MAGIKYSWKEYPISEVYFPEYITGLSAYKNACLFPSHSLSFNLEGR